ncbi:hypothetical protein C0991_001975 [Blastosporella zonata]|nr:hypothetical protein C0991_001975 [Blastosporella zonata]
MPPQPHLSSPHPPSDWPSTSFVRLSLNGAFPSLGAVGGPATPSMQAKVGRKLTPVAFFSLRAILTTVAKDKHSGLGLIYSGHVVSLAGAPAPLTTSSAHFYLDSHHTRPTIQLRQPPPLYHEAADDSDTESTYQNRRAHQRSLLPNRASTNSPSSIRTGSSTFSYHAPLSPPLLQQEFSTSGESAASSSDLEDAA